MKTFLLHKSEDFNWDQAPPPQADAVVQDLELEVLFAAMAGQDPYLRDIALKVVLAGLTDPQTIRYRQYVLSDAMAQPAVIRELYQVAVDTVAGAKKVGHFLMRDSPGSILSRSIQMLEFLVISLRRLRAIADEHGDDLHSDGWATFFGMLRAELDEDYFGDIAAHLSALRFRSGVLVSAELGSGQHGRNYVLRRPYPPQSWWERLTGSRSDGLTLTIADRDEAGARALSDLEGRGINLVANALAQSTDHILSFFHMLRAELGFYVGCLNLRDALAASKRPLSFPAIADPVHPIMAGRGLCDVGLALRRPQDVVGNDVDISDSSLLVITGANQGGKSTFLRSLGAAQLMFQAGMFVVAQQYTANICNGIFTHYKREEDTTMSSGKLDEELARMSKIIDEVHCGGVVLFNESFAATNEREGSEIARQITRALREAGITVWFVTHMFDFADGLYKEHEKSATFLRAERQADGHRTFHLVEGEPLPTSYGPDLYAQIFGPPPADAAGAHREQRHEAEHPGTAAPR